MIAIGTKVRFNPTPGEGNVKGDYPHDGCVGIVKSINRCETAPFNIEFPDGSWVPCSKSELTIVE